MHSFGGKDSISLFSHFMISLITTQFFVHFSWHLTMLNLGKRIDLIVSDMFRLWFSGHLDTIFVTDCLVCYLFIYLTVVSHILPLSFSLSSLFLGHALNNLHLAHRLYPRALIFIFHHITNWSKYFKKWSLDNFK